MNRRTRLIFWFLLSYLLVVLAFSHSTEPSSTSFPTLCTRLTPAIPAPPAVRCEGGGIPCRAHLYLSSCELMLSPPASPPQRPQSCPRQGKAR